MRHISAQERKKRARRLKRLHADSEFAANLKAAVSLPPKKRNGVIASLRVTKNITVTSGRTGVSRKTVSKLAKEAHIEVTHGRPPLRLTAKKRGKVIAVLRATENISAASRETGLTRFTVRKLVREARKKSTGRPKQAAAHAPQR